MSNKDFLEDFTKSLSCERLSGYRTAADGCPTAALRLYAWNTAIGAAFYGPLQGLEIVLRNSVHRALSDQYGPRWFDNLEAKRDLDKGALGKIKEAKRQAAKKSRERNGNEVEAPQVVAALSFGFGFRSSTPVAN